MQDEVGIYQKHKLLFSTFVGSMVEIVIQNADQLIPMSGILLDFDESWAYIGQSIEEISTAVKIDKIVLIAYDGELSFLQNSPLHEMGEPESDLDIN